MPLIERSTYRPPRLVSGGHLQTIYPTLFRRLPPSGWTRERIMTPDGDFLDLDRTRIGADRVAILTHGLEGDSHRAYMRGMGRALAAAGWDVVAWNCRSCSGEPNLLPRFYHSGATEDLHVVVGHALREYGRVALVGFSLGGNMTLKYLGERSDHDPRIAGAVAFSVPCDLRSSSHMLARPANAIYMRRFLTSLRRKVLAKAHMLPFPVDLRELEAMRTFAEFDDRYTAPLHGFRDAEDYWRRCSARQFVPSITVPTLLVSALNDPFLAPECFPRDEARDNPTFTLETPDAGGHVGFPTFGAAGVYWSERRAVEFLRRLV